MLTFIGQVLKHVNDRRPALSFVAKMLNKLLIERDWSAQEISHILLQLPLQSSTRDCVSLNCRPDKDQSQAISIEDGEASISRSPCRKYRDRLTDTKGGLHLQDVSLFQWLREYNFEGKCKWKPRSKALQRVINYYPKYSSLPNSSDYEDYCRVRLMLHHPFVNPDELLVVDGVRFDTFSDAFRSCQESHSHPPDFYEDPVDPDAVDDDIDTNSEYDDLEEEGVRDHDEDEVGNDEMYARRGPRNDLSRIEDPHNLGGRDLDRQYDWSPHAGRYDVGVKWLDEMKAQFPANRDIQDALNPGSLNDQQRKLYDVVTEHYASELSGQNPRQLLLNVDGVAGTGKTYTILQISLRLEELARQYGKPNPVLRSAPTGVASFGILGCTIHTLLSLPVKKRSSELSKATLKSLQDTFKHIRYLVIDEKSMIDLKQLSLIESRLQQIFPSRRMEPFGGLNILICGDFYQLPPVAGVALYERRPKSKDLPLISGQIAYRAFDRTIQLTQLMRQRGEDPIAVQFREALTNLRVNALREEDWRLLCTRVAYGLSPEVDSFRDALRVYFTNEEVQDYNHRQLSDLHAPVVKVKARHTGPRASQASSDEADNLDAEVCLCIGARVMLTKNLWTEHGLVNGAMGTVRDIFWKAGQNPTTDMPYGLMVEFDSYGGPVFSSNSDNSGSVPGRCVPIFASTHTFLLNEVECSRTQFPVRVGYAVTVYKSQGMTRDKIVLRLPSRKDFALGLSYVAISRVKKLSGLLFETGFDYERFGHVINDRMKDRDIDWAARGKQLIE
jgi:ATP-dependent DNA helicase PIF1